MRAYLVVDQAPLLQEGMNSHNGANITGQVSPAGRHSQILDGIQPVRVDHEVSVVLVDMRCLAPVAAVEKLGEGLSFDVVDGVHVKPGAIARKDDGVSLRDEVFPRGVLNALFSLDLSSSALTGLSRVFGVPISGLPILRRLTHLLVFLG